MFRRLHLCVKSSDEGWLGVSLSVDSSEDVELLSPVRVDLTLDRNRYGSWFLSVTVPDRRMDAARLHLLPSLVSSLAAKVPVTPSAVEFRFGSDELGWKTLGPDSLGWVLVDPSGKLVYAMDCFEQGDHDKAAELMLTVVEENGISEGYRTILAGFHHAAGHKDEAYRWIAEELAVHPRSYRAMGLKALMAFEEGAFEEAWRLYGQAVSIYGNYLDGLLGLVASGRRLARDVVPYLARAVVLAGATAWGEIEEAAGEDDELLRKARAAADGLELARGVSRGAGETPGGSTDGGAVDEAAASDSGDLELCKEDVVRIAVRHILRDGKIDASEKVLFKRVVAAFPVPKEKLDAILAEEKAAGSRRRGDEGPCDPKALFRDILVRVYEDGRVTPREKEFVFRLAKILNLRSHEAMRIQRELKEEMKKGEESS